MATARGRGREVAAGWEQNLRLADAPALDVSVDADRAGVGVAHRHLHELAVGGVQAPSIVETPALDGGVGSQTAGVVPACRQGGEASVGRVGLPGVVGAPAFDLAVIAQGAGVLPPRSYRDERPVPSQCRGPGCRVLDSRVAPVGLGSTGRLSFGGRLAPVVRPGRLLARAGRRHQQHDGPEAACCFAQPHDWTVADRPGSRLSLGR